MTRKCSCKPGLLPGMGLRVTAQEYSCPRQKKETWFLFFSLRITDPKRKEKSMKGQRTIKQLNSVYFQSEGTTFHVLKIRWSRHINLKLCQIFLEFLLINVKDSGGRGQMEKLAEKMQRSRSYPRKTQVKNSRTSQMPNIAYSS